MSPRWLEMPSAKPFFQSLLEFGEAGAWTPEDALALFAAESDLTPTAVNKYGFSGLSQIGSRELDGLGYEPSKMGPFHLAAPPVQVRFFALYMSGHRKRHGIERWLSAGHLMAAQLAPAFLSNADHIVYTRSLHPIQYAANELVDRNSDGVIDWVDCEEYVRWTCDNRCAARYQLALTGLAITRHELAMAALDAEAREASGDPAALVSEPLSYAGVPPKQTS